MDKLAVLLALEDLRRLKSRYFRGVDNQDWGLWREEVFAPGASLTVAGGDTVSGVEEIVAWVSGRWRNRLSVHHGHMPDLEILSQNRAHGRWQMDDRLYHRTGPDGPWQLELHGFGYYEEDYVRLDRGWRIQSSVLTRLYVERHDLRPHE